VVEAWPALRHDVEEKWRGIEKDVFVVNKELAKEAEILAVKLKVVSASMADQYF
jgi:hypothetical protein